MARRYSEDFDDGPGGWFAFLGNFQGIAPLERTASAVASYGPWWIDYNHAPPGGAGYLSLLFGLNTRGPLDEKTREYGGPNRFIEGRFPTDFRSATMTLRLRGEMHFQGTQILLLVQGRCEGVCSGWLLTGQPIGLEQAWTEQRLELEPDPAQWTSLGARPERADMYGHRPLERVLADVNTNLYFVLFPLNVVPKGPVPGDPRKLRPGRDYRVWQSELPDGYVEFDSVSIEFPSPSQRDNPMP